MVLETAWRPLRRPQRVLGATPFARLATTHALAIGGDTLVTMALAGSLFFSISPQAARGRVALYLLLTMAPFAVIAPLIGPALDRSRGGRRLILLMSAAARTVVCLLMAKHLNSLLLFPEAFAVLVLSKTYLIAKSSLVPGVVEADDELVEANSRLALLSVAAGFVVAGPGALMLRYHSLGGPWVLRTAAVLFAATAIAATRIPRGPGRQRGGEGHDDRSQLRTAGIRLAASAMSVLRGAVGFLTFLVAFGFRRDHAPSWWFGVVIAASMAGSFVGAAVAPRLRRSVPEERILGGSLLAVGVVGMVTARSGGRPATAALAAALGVAAAAGKLAFDSIVQRDAQDAAQGRTFARFETRFQLVWVLAAAIPVVVPTPTALGMGIIALASGFAAISYASGLKATARRHSHDGEPAA